VASSATESDRGRSNELLARLIRTKRWILVPMVAAYMLSYIGLTILAGFAKEFVAAKVIGSLNVGFILIGANYVLSWILAIVYVRVANRVFDPIAEEAVAESRAEPR
jgi:uncharacterized membrane protein (DUF485 family)